MPHVNDDRIVVLKRLFEVGGAGNCFCFKIQENTSSVKRVRLKLRTCGIVYGTAEVVDKVSGRIVAVDGKLKMEMEGRLCHCAIYGAG